MNTSPRSWDEPYPDPADGPYRLRTWYKWLKGRPVVVGVEMWGVEPVIADWKSRDFPDRAITTQDIRLPLKDMRARWVGIHEALANAMRLEEEDQPDEAIRRQQDELSDSYIEALKTKSRGRPPLGRELLAGVARTYTWAAATGRNVGQAVVEYGSQVQEREVPESTARGWIYEARQRGFLPPVVR